MGHLASLNAPAIMGAKFRIHLPASGIIRRPLGSFTRRERNPVIPRHLLSRSALLALLALTPVLHAQKFQEPSRADLQMTADPAAPGAPAVYLDIQETTDNRSHYVSEYARIKVLTEAGKEYATVEVPRSGGQAPPIIEGRTIHPDGTIVPLTGKAADLLTRMTAALAIANPPSTSRSFVSFVSSW